MTGAPIDIRYEGLPNLNPCFDPSYRRALVYNNDAIVSSYSANAELARFVSYRKV